MLNCKEQKNPVDFFGRKITLSEQALNAMASVNFYSEN